MDFSRYRSWLGVPSLLLAGFVSTASALDNPGYDRPGLGFTPVVLGAGDITLEQGLPDWSLARASSGDSAQYTADSLLRLGIGQSLELQFGSSYNRLSQGDAVDYGRGDSTLALKFAPPARGNFSWGLLGSIEFTDGASDFRNPRRQYLLGTEFNWQLDERNGLALYLENVRSGGHDSRQLAVSDGYAFTPRFSGYVEFGVMDVSGVGQGSRAGAGLAWMLTPRVQLDASMRHRLDGAAPEWEAGLGIAVYFGR
ncbi:MULTISPECIES: transporter [Rhodanobacter]|uniref:Transporter n=1 Tax=Rhodanobacter hydrolyticus TaxID=2250595 RepID=A0ABW8J1E8_9GAMM|nr:transporter [Rhodanobacter sp. 7MK24]MBD8881006.1 transporter [Rhodanobacter sp. 7MK24]